VTAKNGPDRYRLIQRRLACVNERFEVFFDTIEQPDGSTIGDFLVVQPRVRHADEIAGICVLPEVGGRIGLMSGYRHHVGTEVWQAPAGFVEAGETPEETALRELREEAALTCKPGDLIPLGTFLPDAGLIAARVALFLAQDAKPVGAGAMRCPEVGSGELIFFGEEELTELIATSGKVGGSTLVACFRYLLLLEENERRARSREQR